MESEAVQMGVAIVDYHNAKTRKKKEKQRRRIRRMLRNYEWHVDIVTLAERTIATDGESDDQANR